MERELTHVKVQGQWLLVYQSGFDQFLKENYYTVKTSVDSYVDIFEFEVEEKKYEEHDQEYSDNKFQLLKGRKNEDQ